MPLSTLNHALIENAPECVSAYDNRLFITLWNKACEKKFGIPASEAIGKHLLHLFPNIGNDYRVLCLQLAADGGKTFFFPNMTYVLTQPFSLYSQYIRPIRKNGENLGVVNIVRDHPGEEAFTVDDFRHFFLQ